MKTKKITKPTLEGDTYLVAQAVNHNAEVLEGALNRISKLEKRLVKEKMTGKPIKIEEFSKSEDMTREEAIDLVMKVFDTLEGECNIEYDWSKEHKARDMAIKALDQETFKDAYIKQVVKERDVAFAQLNELGYSLGQKIRHCEKTVSVQDCINAIENTDCELSPQAWEEISNSIMLLPSVAPKQDPILSEARAKIEEQKKWLAEAGYNAYNVDIAFESVKRALEK